MTQNHLSAEDTARLLAIAFTKYEGNRARISEKAVQTLSGRDYLSPRFLLDLFEILPDHGIMMAPLECGGFGIMWSRSLMAAKSLTLTAEQVAALYKELV